MFAWFGRTKRAADLLAQATERMNETAAESRAVAQKYAQLYENQTAHLSAVQSENARLWAALAAPAELQPYIAVGATESEARQLASDAPRGA